MAKTIEQRRKRWKRRNERKRTQGINGNWFFCKGCGGLIGFFPEGLTRDGETLPPGAVVHSEPAAFLDLPGRVQTTSTATPCELFRRSEPDQLAELHKDAHPAEPPSDFRPVRG